MNHKPCSVNDDTQLNCKDSQGDHATIDIKQNHKNTELQGKFKKESLQSNGKIKSSNTSNEWITTVIFLT